MVAGPMHPGFGHQRGEPGDKVQRLEDDVRAAVSVWSLERVATEGAEAAR